MVLLNLPKPIGAYFSADRYDSESVAACFTEDAVVEDEGHTYRGQDAIKKWVVGYSSEFTFTCEPFASEMAHGKTVVTGKVTGTFPGSPVDLRYTFGLEGDKIASLVIS